MSIVYTVVSNLKSENELKIKACLMHFYPDSLLFLIEIIVTLFTLLYRKRACMIALLLKRTATLQIPSNLSASMQHYCFV